MSAFLVEEATIDVILQFATKRNQYGSLRYFWQGTWREVTTENADEIGAILWKENTRSVNHRYGEDDATPEYRYVMPDIQYSLVQVAKCVQCLDYQSCETDDWQETEAYCILQAVNSKILHALPGWEEAKWGVTENPNRQRIQRGGKAIDLDQVGIAPMLSQGIKTTVAVAEEPVIDISVTDTAKLVRAALKTAFPGQKFFVNKRGNAIRVYWQDGPTAEAVNAVAKEFECKLYDGYGRVMQNNHRIHPITGKKVSYGARYVFAERSYSLAFLQKVAQMVADEYGVPVPVVKEYSYRSDGRFDHTEAYVDQNDNQVAGGQGFYWTVWSVTTRKASETAA